MNSKYERKLGKQDMAAHEEIKYKVCSQSKNATCGKYVRTQIVAVGKQIRHARREAKQVKQVSKSKLERQVGSQIRNVLQGSAAVA